MAVSVKETAVMSAGQQPAGYSGQSRGACAVDADCVETRLRQARQAARFGGKLLCLQIMQTSRHGEEKPGLTVVNRQETRIPLLLWVAAASSGKPACLAMPRLNCFRKGESCTRLPMFRLLSACPEYGAWPHYARAKKTENCVGFLMKRKEI